jgi:hypothetical protein
MKNDGYVDPKQRDDCEVYERACSGSGADVLQTIGTKGPQISELSRA